MNTTDKDHTGKDDKVLEELFRHVSSRERAPQSVEREIREALHDEWTQQVRQRRTRRRVASWAIAAAVVLAVFVFTGLFRQPVPDVQRPLLASVEKKTGDVFLQEPDGRAFGQLDSRQISAGNELFTTQDSRIALSWVNGESVRLDQNSRVALISSTEIELLSGKVYIDSAGVRVKGKAFRILTPSGPVSHIGTQYITAIVGHDVTISVREGEVAVGSGEDKSIAVPGQKLLVSNDGKKSITTIPTYGEDWLWAEAVAPQFNMEGRTLKDLLDWVGRETGRKIEYDSASSEIAAAQTRMHGNIDLEPLRAMELMLQTSDLTHEIKDGVILVSL